MPSTPPILPLTSLTNSNFHKWTKDMFSIVGNPMISGIDEDNYQGSIKLG